MLTLKRTYYPDRTEGIITMPDGQELRTLERPWLGNVTFISCIPEDTYIVERDKFGRHRWYKIVHVDKRSFIEIHPATIVTELEGCIALGLDLIDGKLIDSVKACEVLLNWFGDDSFVLRITS